MARRRSWIGFSTASLVVSLSAASPAFGTDHFNLEADIPTTIEDIEPTERGGVELQGFGRYLRLLGRRNVGQTALRIAWGVLEKTQLEIALPLLLGDAASNGNGDVDISMLRKLWADRARTGWPGLALEADVRPPTGAEDLGFTNRVDAGLTILMKKDLGPHSLHFNAGCGWTGDRSEEEEIRSFGLSVVLGHDTPLTRWLLLVSDVVWRQGDDEDSPDVWLVESGVRAQVSRSLIGAIGAGVGLNRGSETPLVSVTVGLQFSP